jgi:aminoglycoside phosphotransferase (APT) family kinase protein
LLKFDQTFINSFCQRRIGLDLCCRFPAFVSTLRRTGVELTRDTSGVHCLARKQERAPIRYLPAKSEVIVSPGEMHADEMEVDVPLVTRLLATQFPHWADLPVAPVPSAGTDNALYRLGDELAVRLPRIHWAVDDVDKEQRWLPKLAPHLPLAVPVPLAQGAPGEGYPWSWSVYRWIEGQDAVVGRIADPCQAAADLARFVSALQAIDPTGGPPPGAHNSYRGAPLVERDAPTRAALAALRALQDRRAAPWRDAQNPLDLGTATAAWEAALRAPAWHGPPVWLHGDLLPGNLLVRQGRLCGVIDFGCLGVGEPAMDLTPAWTLFSKQAREVYRAALGVDDATWARGRGWALSFGLIALPYYHTTNPVLAGIYRHAIDQILADLE